MFAISCKRTAPVVWKSRVKLLTILQMLTRLSLSSAICFMWSQYIETTWFHQCNCWLSLSFILSLPGVWSSWILTTSSILLGKDIICKICCFLSDSVSRFWLHWQSMLSTWYFRLLLACISKDRSTKWNAAT